MSKYRGPRFRVIRRLGGLPSLTTKTSRRDHHTSRSGTSRKQPKQFSIRLKAKQRLRFYYGVSEKNLIRHVRVARGQGFTGRVLRERIEIRLDNIVYRLGWARTMPHARQLVNHCHILVDKQRVNIPSFSCVPKQTITVRHTISSRRLLRKNLQEHGTDLPSHLCLDTESITATVIRGPNRDEIPLEMNELIVIEYYSNRLLKLT